MDRYTTRFKALKKGEEIVGFEISAAGETNDEFLCTELPQRLNNGKANITVCGGKIHINFSEPKEEWDFNLSEDEECQLQEIISGLGKTHQAHCGVSAGFGFTFKATFERIAKAEKTQKLNKRELHKRKMTFSKNRNPTRPKDPKKLAKWNRMYS